MSKLGTRLIEGLNEALAIARKNPAALRTITYERADVSAIRKELRLTQTEFAARFRISAATVRDWEQGRRVAGRQRQQLPPRDQVRAQGR